jgi:hypothetical protein
MHGPLPRPWEMKESFLNSHYIKKKNWISHARMKSELSKIFVHQLMHKTIVLKTILKLYVKINFGAVTPSSGSALFLLAKDTFALPYDGVTAPKTVGAVLTSIFKIVFKTIHFCISR